MKGLIIAAGRGKRLCEYTEIMPKPLVKVNEFSFFENTINIFNGLNIYNVAAIIGYRKEKFHKFKDIKFFHNTNWKNNNILHSLFYAKDFFDDDIIISYGDIWFEQKIFLSLLEDKNDITIVVDKDWEDYYKGRTEHPISEAEKVFYTSSGKAVLLGKNINTPDKSLHIGEFTGLMKISKNVILDIIEEYEKLLNKVSFDEVFYNAKRFEEAYLTDFLMFLIDKLYNVSVCVISKGWYEIDTPQDLLNLKKRLDYDRK